MEVLARMTSKGQVTLPKAVRDALGLAAGDRIVFRVESQRAILAHAPKLLRYEIHALDFAEAFLAASGERSGVPRIVSFDRSIDKVDTVTRIEPS